MARPIITAERLRELLNYDPLTGVFTWRVNRRGGAVAGEVAGCTTERGYISIYIEGRNYFAHRLAWLYVHGKWPEHEIDHRYGVRNDNRWSELMPCTHGVNMQNQRKARSDNKCGILGVCQRGARWMAGIRVDGKSKHLGYHDTPELAHAAYLDAKREIHPGCTI